MEALSLGRLAGWLTGRRGAHRLTYGLSLRAAAQEAEARGLALLKENLTAAQRRQLEMRGAFEVLGGETGRRYRIRRGAQMNVEQLDQRGRPVCILCFVPEGNLVTGDVLLAQKLALELFELDTLAAANKFSPHPTLWATMP
jgi:hypothetical protein